MADKPTFQEVEQKVQQLDKRSEKFKQMEKYHF